MKIEVKQEGGVLLLRLSGELDHATAGSLREAVDQRLSAGIRHLLLDMQGLTFMDSSGIGAILGRYKKLHETGGEMALCHVPAAVAKVLEISGIPKIIPVFKNVETALRQLGRQGNSGKEK